MALTLIILPIGCSANNSNEYATNDNVSVSYNMAEDGMNDSMSMEPEMDEEAAYDDFGGMNNKSTLTTSESIEPQVNDRKIIKSASMEIETLEYDLAIDSLTGKINNVGGYIESSNVRGKSINNGYSRRSAYYTIRIPQDRFPEFMESLNTIGNIISQNTYGEDITSQYFDSEARVKTLEVQEERLLDILKKAENVEDIIELERALANVRYEIESLTGTIRRWDNLVSYATLNVSLYEVFEITEEEVVAKTLSEKIGQAFKTSIDNIQDFFESTLISGLGATPYLIFVIPGLIILIIIFRKVKRGYMTGREQKQLAQEQEIETSQEHGEK